MTYTPWFCAVTQSPVRVGWYDYRCARLILRSIGYDVRHEKYSRLFWNGSEWQYTMPFMTRFVSWTPCAHDQWRGVLREGE